MPSFLFQEQQPTIQPYQHPSELMVKAGMYRDAKFKEGLQNIRSRYDNLLNLQLTNPGNQQFVRDQLKMAVDQLDKYTTADLSLPENVGSVMSLFDPVTDDTGVLNDMAFTQHMNKQKAKIEQLSIDNPDLVAPQNVFPLLQAEQRYRSSARNATPEYATFQPYYQFEKADNEFLTKLKEDISRDPELVQIKDPVTGEVIGLRGEREVKELSKQRIMQAMVNSFDPRKVNQMQLDYNYALSTGVFNRQNAIRGIDQDIADQNVLLQNAKEVRNTGRLSVAQLGDLDKKIQTIQQEIGRLNILKTSIGADPSRATDYYTFDKYLNDYVRQKADEYSYRQEGELEVNEYDKEVFKFGMDLYLENLKSNLRIKEERAKSEGDSDSETGLRPDGSFAIEPPIKKVIDQVMTKGSAQLDWSNPELLPLLGNAQKEKDGSITWLNTGGGDKVLADRVFIKEGKETLDPKSAQLLQLNTLIGKEIERLRKRYPHRFEKKTTVTTPGGSGAFGVPQSTTTATIPLNEAESVRELQALVDTYRSGNITTTAKGELKPLVDALDQLGIQTITEQHLADYSRFVGSDKGKSIVEAGVLLNADGKGKYEFIPDGKDNIISMSDGRLGVSGSIALSEEDIDRIGIPVGKMQRDGVLTRVAPETAYQDVNGKAAKVVTDKYWLSVVLPVNGNLEDINKRMFEAGDMQKMPLKEQYSASRMNDAAFKLYSDLTRASLSELEPTSQNTFRPREGSSVDQAVKDVLRLVDGTQNGKTFREEYEQLLRTPQTRYNLMNNLGTFIRRATTAASPANVQLDRDQLNVLDTIRAVGRQVGATERDIQTAIATAMTETGLKNLNYGDRDSVGIFQQRPSQGWGTVEQLIDPNESIRRFFLGVPDKNIPGLLSIKDRERKSIQELAQQVQRSAFPERYGRWAQAFNFK